MIGAAKSKARGIGSGLDIVLRYGFLALLVWTPLAFGSVHTWAYAALEIHVWLLIAISLIPYLSIRRHSIHTPAYGSLLGIGRFVWPLVLFLALLIVQQIPLPPPVLGFLSPQTAALYQQYLPGWPEHAAPLSFAPYSTQLALGKYVAYAGCLYLCLSVLRTRRDIQAVCWVVIGVGCVMAIVGILQAMSGTDAIYWTRDASYTQGRFFGPYLNRNHFASYQTIAMTLGLGLLLTQPLRIETTIQLRWRRRLFQLLGLLTPARLFLVCALSLMAASMILAASRGGAMSLLLSLFCLIALLIRHRIRLRRQVVLALGLLAMAGMVIWLGLGPLLMRFAQLASDSPAQLWAGRWPAFQAAWKMSMDFPLFGIGYEAFPMLSAHYQPMTDMNQRYFHVHNDLLQLLAETGWFGFSLFSCSLLWVIWSSCRQWRTRRDPFVQIIVAAGLAALVAIAFHSLVDFNFHIPANALLFTTVLGMTFACAHLPRHGARSQLVDPERGGGRRELPMRRGRSMVFAGLGLLAVCGLTIDSLRLAAADLMYPYEEVLQPNHWVYRAHPDVVQRRLQQAMQWAPNNPWYWRQLAALEMQTAWTASPLHDDVTGAMRQYARDALERAVIAYERALQSQPTEPHIQLSWLNAQHRLAQLQLALPPTEREVVEASYARIAALAPASPNIQYGLGLILLEAEANGQVSMSPHRFFRQAIELDTTYGPKILQAYLRLLPEDEARHRFASTIPNTPEAHQQAAQMLEPTNWRQARLHYQTALILSHSNSAILRTYAEALMRQRDFVTARRIWERLRDQMPGQSFVYLGLAAALRHLDNWEAAVQVLQQLVNHFPQEASYQAQLALAYGRCRQVKDAEATWKRAIHMQPYEVSHYAGLARLYEAQGSVENAILMMQRAVSIAPEHAAYQQALARLYEHSGHRDKAVQIYERLASYQTDDPQPLYKLGTYAQQQGHLSRAVAYYRRALRLKPGHTGFQKALDRALQELAKR